MMSSKHPPSLTRRSALIGIANASVLQSGPVLGQPAVSPKHTSPPPDDESRAVNDLITEHLLWDEASPVLGNPHGDVTIAEFFDYRCPFRKAMAPKLLDLTAKDTSLRVVMKEYPILCRESVFAAKVALVAGRHSAYLAYHAGMFALTEPFDKQTVLHVAQVAGVLPAIARGEMNDPEVLAELFCPQDAASGMGDG